MKGKQRSSKWALRGIAMIGVSAAAAGSLLVGGGVAGAAEGGATCSEGSRSQAKSIAKSGNFTTPTGEVSWKADNQFNAGPPGPNQYYKVSLRYSKETGCSWALLGAGDWWSTVWLERETRGKVERLGERNPKIGQDSTYTGVYRSQWPNAVRACASNDGNQKHCTAWFNGT